MLCTLSENKTTRVSAMPAIAYDWELNVERGPNWLLVKVGAPSGKPWEMLPLADTLRSLLEDHFTCRLVLELDEIDLLTSELIRQLLMLDKWIRARRGVMRLCGLSPRNQEILRRCWLHTFFALYSDRLEAVTGRRRPSQQIEERLSQPTIPRTAKIRE